MKFLGHTDVKKTLIYIDLEITYYSRSAEEYTAKVAATTITEALQPIETGFEFHLEMDGAKIFRKRK